MSDLRIPTIPLATAEDEEEESQSLGNGLALGPGSAILAAIAAAPRLNGNGIPFAELPRHTLSAPGTPRRRPRNLGSRERSRSRGSPSSADMDNFNESGGSDFNEGGSLEDLVSHFDSAITECFANPDAVTEELAPVQVRTQEEIMSESQVWWTLTGNFGSMGPIDFSKTQTRKLQLPTLNLRPKPETNGNEGSELDLDGDTDEEEELAAALDLHSLILSPHSSLDGGPTSAHSSLPQTADQVIREIDEIMQGSSTGSEATGSSDATMESGAGWCSPLKSPLLLASLDPSLGAKLAEAAGLAGDAEKETELRQLPYKKLSSLACELESLIQAYNESLVAELALKDELEWEKELKNSFISLLLSVQAKRRSFVAAAKRRPAAAGAQPLCLTTAIPYQPARGPPDNAALQALIKILRAVNEESPHVPNILTDYILNVLCPSAAETPTSLPIC